MKEIKAVVRPNKLAGLRTALRAVPGFPGMTVLKGEGFGAPATHVAHNIKEELTDYTPRVWVVTVVPDELAEAIVDRIASVATTGQIGDGLVWVTDVERAIFMHKSMPGPDGK